MSGCEVDWARVEVAPAAIGGLGPDIHDVGVADSVREDAGGADQATAGIGQAGGKAIAEGCPQLLWRAAVIEVIRPTAAFISSQSAWVRFRV